MESPKRPEVLSVAGQKRIRVRLDCTIENPVVAIRDPINRGVSPGMNNEHRLGQFSCDRVGTHAIPSELNPKDAVEFDENKR